MLLLTWDRSGKGDGEASFKLSTVAGGFIPPESPIRVGRRNMASGSCCRGMASLYPLLRNKKHGFSYDAMNASEIQTGMRVQIRVKTPPRRKEDATGMLAWMTEHRDVTRRCTGHA